MSSDYREPYEIQEEFVKIKPKNVLGHLDEEVIDVKKADYYHEFMYPICTRLTRVYEREFEDRVLGVNFYSLESGYPWRVDLIMDKEPYLYGSIITIDEDENLTYSILDRKTQNQTTPE